MANYKNDLETAIAPMPENPTQVLDPATGVYLCTTFEGDTGVWKLIGTEEGEHIKEKPGAKWYDGNLGLTIDEFRGTKGRYLKAKRKSVYAMQKEGKIKPYKAKTETNGTLPA